MGNYQSICEKHSGAAGRRQSSFTLLESRSQGSVAGAAGVRRQSEQNISLGSNNARYSLSKVTEELLLQKRRMSCDTALLEMRELRNANLVRAHNHKSIHEDI